MVLRSGRKLSPMARQGISGMGLIYPLQMTHVLFLVQRKSSQAAVVTEVGDAKKDQKAGSLTVLLEHWIVLSEHESSSTKVVNGSR